MSTAVATRASDLVKAAGANPDYFTDESDVAQYSSAQVAVADKMMTLVKGIGYANKDKPSTFGEGGNAPLTDPDAVFARAQRADKAWGSAIRKGINDPGAVYKSLSPEFSSRFGAFLMASPQASAMNSVVANLQQQISDAIGKSITLTSPLATGLVPFNLN